MVEEYNKCKNKLEEICNSLAVGVNERKRKLFEEGKKSSTLKSFFKKKQFKLSLRNKLENKAISDPNKINNEYTDFLKICLQRVS